MSAPDRLSQIPTAWTVVRAAHDPAGDPAAVRAARLYLLSQYEAFARRYLAASLARVPDRDEAVADCCQEFALRFVRGAFRNASPDRGKFRHYVKRCLSNLATDRLRAGRGGPLPLADHDPEGPPDPAEDAAFHAAWREELTARALDRLRAEEVGSTKHIYTVLRARLDRPDLRSHELAEHLSAVVGRPVSDVWVRKRASAGRGRLAELLVAEVRASLDRPTADDLVDELVEVGLYEHCRSALGGGA